MTKSRLDLDQFLAKTDPDQVITSESDWTIQGKLTVQALVVANWSVVEYVVRIIEQVDAQDTTVLRLRLGVVSQKLDALDLTAGVNKVLKRECFPFRVVVQGFTYEVLQDDKGVWYASTLAHIVLRDVVITDLIEVNND